MGGKTAGSSLATGDNWVKVKTWLSVFFQVLLNTLVYFNTKYFQLKTVDMHLKLSFSHIMKHWKKATTNMVTKPGQQQRTVLLRYYPPPAKGQKPEDRKMYEQHENHENPLRCPVKLYEFYLSKCPESTKNRNDMFYLQPERSCVPDSPVWYSGQLLNRSPSFKHNLLHF